MKLFRDQTTPPAVAGFGERQQLLLRLLQQEKAGLTVDDLTARLQVTRAAVRQHLAALERDGYVRKQGLRLTGGRPGYVYTLTAVGHELFPKQYSWFSSLVLTALRRQGGSEGLIALMRQLAAGVATNLADRMAGKTPAKQIQELERLLNEMGYNAQVKSPPDAVPTTVVATHCVYHALAEEFSEVCHFDLELMGRLTGVRIQHAECMVRGGQVCRFLFEAAAPPAPGKE
jgi:predicted ArsR family transcriptional regulator